MILDPVELTDVNDRHYSFVVHDFFIRKLFRKSGLKVNYRKVEIKKVLSMENHSI